MTTDSKGIWPVELKEQYMRGKYLYKEFMDIVSRESALAYEKYKDLHFSKSGFIGMMERTTEYQRYSALIDLYNEFERDKGHFIQYEKKAQDKAETPETEPFFLQLLNTDSPGTYKAIQKGIDSGRIRITPEGKLDFRFIKKGTLAHIFRTGGYTDWSRVKSNVLIDGQEITGSLKNLAAIEPPKDFEEIKKELYPN